MKYNIKDAEGNIINTIVANAKFVDRLTVTTMSFMQSLRLQQKRLLVSGEIQNYPLLTTLCL